jgi:hypothetical protein
MPSSYTPSLRLVLPVTGELTGTWGDTVNDGLTDLVDASVAGTAAVTMSDANYTLTVANGASDESRQMFVTLTGTLGASRDVICPTASKLYFVTNSTTGGFSIVFKTSAGTGITVPNGFRAILYCDGTNVVSAANYQPALALGTALPVASGGTGITSFGTGVATALGQNVTGSGGIALATSPSFTTPVLGTPTSGTLSGCTVDGTDSVGFRNTPVNSQSAAYTLVLADSGKTIFHPASDNNARTFTIPANSSVAYAVGTVVSFINLAAADVTIAITTDTMYLGGDGATGSRTLAEYGIASALKVSSTNWVISGNGLT